jgi:hypothetical protein
MQITIYYNSEDEWLSEKLQVEAYRARRSVSQTVLKIWEESLGVSESGEKGEAPWAERGRRGKQK